MGVLGIYQLINSKPKEERNSLLSVSTPIYNTYRIMPYTDKESLQNAR